MKTLLFTLEYPPFHGGVANYYGNLVKHWPEQENIFILDNGRGALINNKLPALKWLPAFFALWRTISKNKIEHIIVGQILPLGTVAWLVCRFRGIKYSLVLHGMDLGMSKKSARKKWLAKKIMVNANHLVCNSNYTAKVAREFLVEEEWGKISVVNPGVDNPKFQDTNFKIQISGKHNLQNKIILLSVGRLVKRKGFDMVIKALPDALKEAPDLVYVVAGAGEEEKSLKEAAIKLGLEKKVLFLGDISDQEKWNWLDLCDMFIMPSRNINGDFEGFGIVFLEANLAQKPVIAGDSGGVGDAVANGLNGLLVNPEDIDDISLAIVELTKDKDLRERLGREGKKRAEEFLWPKQIKKIYNILNNQK